MIVQRYGVTNVELEEALRANGAEVIEIPTYRWSLPDDTQLLPGHGQPATLGYERESNPYVQMVLESEDSSPLPPGED